MLLDASTLEISLRVPELESHRSRAVGARRGGPSSAPSNPGASHSEFQFRSQVSEQSYLRSEARVCTSPRLSGLGEIKGATR